MQRIDYDAFYEIIGYLSGTDVYRTLVYVSSKFHADVLNANSGLWKKLCFQDFGFVGSSELAYKDKWVGFYKYKHSTFEYCEENIHVPQTAPGTTKLRIVDDFLTGLLHGTSKLLCVVPKAFSWSLIRLVRLYGNKKPDLSMISSISSQLNEGLIDIDIKLADQFSPLLECFEGGEYGLRLVQSREKEKKPVYVGSEPVPFPTFVPYRQGGDHTYYQPGDIDNNVYGCANLTYFTQRMHDSEGNPTNLCSDERIQYYKKKISEGSRPIIFAIRLRDDIIILDGHHKFLAYNRYFSELEPPILYVFKRGHSENSWQWKRSNNGNLFTWVWANKNLKSSLTDVEKDILDPKIDSLDTIVTDLNLTLEHPPKS